MDEILSRLLDFLVNADQFHRLMTLWAWCLGGILMAMQASQLGEERPIPWLKLNDRSKPYWFLLYITETLLFTTGAYPVILNKMSGFVLFFGHEQQILNGLWLGLVGIEILMVLGATGIFVARSFQSAPKQKAQ